MGDLPAALRDALREPARLALLSRLGPSRAGTEPAFDSLARLAARLTGAPMGLVTLVRPDEQVALGCHGAPADVAATRRLPVTVGFCPWTVAHGNEFRGFCVSDARADERHRANPAVTGLGLHAYAGVPLALEGRPVGALCVYDRRPRAWSQEHLDDLGDLARSALAELELRLASAERRQLLGAFDATPCLVAMTRGPDHRVVFANERYAAAFGDRLPAPAGRPRADGRDSAGAGGPEAGGPEAGGTIVAPQGGRPSPQPPSRLPEATPGHGIEGRAADPENPHPLANGSRHRPTDGAEGEGGGRDSHEDQAQAPAGAPVAVGVPIGQGEQPSGSGSTGGTPGSAGLPSTAHGSVGRWGGGRPAAEAAEATALLTPPAPPAARRALPAPRASAAGAAPASPAPGGAAPTTSAPRVAEPPLRVGERIRGGRARAGNAGAGSAAATVTAADDEGARTLAEAVERAYRTGRQASASEVALPGGGDPRGPRWVTCVASPLRLPREHQPAGVLIVGMDVTREIRAREELRAGHERIRRTALTLQRSLLCGTPPQPPTLRVSARYQPSGDRDAGPGSPADPPENAVGGDWYDVIDLGAGRTALTVGDVMGRGVHAAAAMGQLRTAVRTLAHQDLPPGELLGRLDAIVLDLLPEQLVTVLYAVHDAAAGPAGPGRGGILRYARAGHLPPLLASAADGSVRVLRAGGDPPLGTASGPQLFTEHRIALGAGDTLLLYTDGLVERRDRDLDEGIEALAALLAGPARPVDELSEHLLRRMAAHGGGEDDDTTLLVARVPAHAAWCRAQWAVPAGPGRLGEARRFATRTLRGWGLGDAAAGDAETIAGELLANAVRHGLPPVELRLLRTADQVCVEVRDGLPVLPRARPQPLAATAPPGGGRGLHVVATLARRWGARLTDTGKSVWAELRDPSAPPTP